MREITCDGASPVPEMQRSPEDREKGEIWRGGEEEKGRSLELQLTWRRKEQGGGDGGGPEGGVRSKRKKVTGEEVGSAGPAPRN
jgi:hypothetical protein